MKIAAINALPTGSPATIMRGILDVANEELGADCVSFYGNWKACPKEYKGSLRFGSRIENYASAMFSQRTGLQGIGSVFGTIQLIRKLERFNPDILHLHNLHLWCINLPLLFQYIKKRNIRVVWTLHDCWAFTGRCPYFQMTKCNRWKEGCHSCPYPPKDYPASYRDQSKRMWKKKKLWFTNVPNMTLVTPSKWLADLVSQSYLSGYPIKVINNGINLTVFKPIKSNFRKEHAIELTKTIVLGVSLAWSKYKGIDVFMDLYHRLDKESFTIVLVGVNQELKTHLPDGIICVEKTNSPEALAEIYSVADIFVNPTREENYPTVNMESIACGTPVVTFNTGGSSETLSEKTGEVVECDDVDSLIKAIQEIRSMRKYHGLDGQNEAKRFDMNDAYKKYLKLYENVY